MGSHYIPVGKIKIDKEILDIACPAAGYTPELICPAAGYIKEPGQPHVPPVQMGVPADEEIWLLCQKTGFGVLFTQAYISGGQWYMEVYDSNNNIVHVSDNKNNGNNLLYAFEGNEGDYFTVKFKLTGAYSFTQWKVYQSTDYGGGDYPIIQAKFNTPNITSLANAFQGVKMLRDVQLISTVANLKSLYYCFRDSGLRYWKPDAVFDSLTTLSYAFYNSDVEVIDFSGSTFPLLNTIANMCQNTTFLYKFIFPANLPNLASCVSAFQLSGIVLLTLFTNAPKVTTYSNFLRDCQKLTGTITIPESLVCTTLFTAFYNCYKLDKAIINGAMPICTSLNQLCYNCYSLTELQCPNTLGVANLNYDLIQKCYELKKLTLPDTLGDTTTFSVVVSIIGRKIEEFHGNMDAPSSVSRDFNYPCSNVRIVDMPNYRVYRIFLGLSYSNPAPITEINIDWANSAWDPSYTPCIRLYCQLGAAELNRIYGLLPVVSGNFRIAVSYNPGFAASDPSIATAKGWTVL